MLALARRQQKELAEHIFWITSMQMNAASSTSPASVRVSRMPMIHARHKSESEQHSSQVNPRNSQQQSSHSLLTCIAKPTQPVLSQNNKPHHIRSVNLSTTDQTSTGDWTTNKWNTWLIPNESLHVDITLYITNKHPLYDLFTAFLLRT